MDFTNFTKTSKLLIQVENNNGETSQAGARHERRIGVKTNAKGIQDSEVKTKRQKRTN